MLGKRLKISMKAKKMNQRRLSEKTGIMESTISRWLRDERKPNADNIIIICKELDISADWLLGLKG